MREVRTETSGVEVCVYSKDGPVTFTDAYGAKESEWGFVTSCDTQKTLGAPSGQFSLTVKPAPGQKDLRLVLEDDNWVDVSFTRHGRPFHVMRGLVDSIRRNEMSAAGATSVSFVIVGRDFSKIFDQTPVFYNIATSQNVGSAKQLEIFDSLQLAGNHVEVMQKTLIDWLAQFQSLDQGQWSFPSGMPGLEGKNSFPETLSINDSQYDTSLNRLALTPLDARPQETSLLSLAMQWSDPVFCELIFDVYAEGDPILESNFISDETHPTLLPEDSRMTIMMRDKPFFRRDYAESFLDNPVHIIEREHIQSTDLVRSGEERRNAFFVAPAFPHQAAMTTLDIFLPDWSPDDIAKHGLRRFDVTTLYTVDMGADSDMGAIGLLSRNLRDRVADWMCLNGELYSGQVTCARLYPQIRVGSRVRIPHEDSRLEENYYVESVSHQYAAGRGGTTTIGVTRGFVGSDELYMQRVRTVRGTYSEVTEVSSPGDFVQAMRSYG